MASKQETNSASCNQGQPSECIGREMSLDLAVETLATGDFQQRWEAAKLLSNWGEVAVVPLLKLLETEEADLELCWFIARILGDLDSPQAIEALVNLLATTESEDVKAMAATALASLGTKAIAPLSLLLKDSQWRLLAVRSLGQIDHPDTIEPLLSAVQDPLPTTRAAAIAALSNFRDRTVAALLIEALDDPVAEVRLEATIGLGRRSDLLAEIDLVELLQRRLQDEDLAVNQQAAIALSRCQTETAIAALFQTLQSPNTPVELQVSIVRAISWIEIPQALKYLEQASKLRSLPVCREIVLVLGRVEKAELKSIAAAILSNLLASNNPVFQQPEIKQALALGLGQLGAVEQRESLNKLLQDPDSKVRLHASTALKKLGLST